jgi:hypothetical protein
MAIGINGTITKGIEPHGANGSAFATMQPNNHTENFKSCNQPLQYQVLYSNSGTELTVASKDNFVTSGSNSTGDILNIIFEVYHHHNINNPINDWTLLTSITKAKDLPNKHYISKLPASGQRFTIDISPLCQDLLSYSLVPINKGTWRSPFFGGMNGGITVQDNVADLVSSFNVTKNGSFRYIKVKAKCQVIKSDGTLVIADDSSSIIDFKTLVIVNSVNTIGEDNYYAFQVSEEPAVSSIIRSTRAINTEFMLSSSSTASGGAKGMSNCPNYTSKQESTPEYQKLIRTSETAEWEYHMLHKFKTTNVTSLFALRVEPLGGGTIVYLTDFNSNLYPLAQNADGFAVSQNVVFVQNVSYQWIKNNAKNDSGVATTNPFTTATTGFRTSVVSKRTSDNAFRRHSVYRYYKIDDETVKPAYNISNEFVRFHWLNRQGGIDSFTAKKDITEGLSVTTSTIERKSANSSFFQQHITGHTAIISDTNRGGDFYKGGREVFKKQAQRTQSVYTSPLNKPTAKWLEELITSPNVWIEQKTNASIAVSESDVRVSELAYIPVIITNSDIETVNQQQGLVSFNLQYTLAHKLSTQRN